MCDFWLQVQVVPWPWLLLYLGFKVFFAQQCFALQHESLERTWLQVQSAFFNIHKLYNMAVCCQRPLLVQHIELRWFRKLPVTAVQFVGAVADSEKGLAPSSFKLAYAHRICFSWATAFTWMKLNYAKCCKRVLQTLHLAARTVQYQFHK